MLEKLIENWLDSTNERSYQAVFVQMLAAQGYRVVHSTRHTALEFGKDVLAVAPDGTGCAYQLKGNPGGRLGLTQFRAEILPQLLQLIGQPVVYPGFPEGPHRAYIVSNGYFEEEVQRSVDELNRGGYRSQISLISRGDLREWAVGLGSTLWPSELRQVTTILELYLAEPRDLLPVAKLSELTEDLLGLVGEEKFKGRADFDRHIESAALLTGIATARFADCDNHYAVLLAWVTFAVGLIGAQERYRGLRSTKFAATLGLAESAIEDALVRLWGEVSDRRHLAEGNFLADPEVYAWRMGILTGLLSILALWDESRRMLPAESSDRLKTWLMGFSQPSELWGETTVAHAIPRIVWMQKHDPTFRSEGFITELLRSVISRNNLESALPLPPLHRTFQQVFRSLSGYAHRRHDGDEEIQSESAGSSEVARALFHLLARSNMKQTCKDFWPEFSKLNHCEYVPDHAWQFCVQRIAEGAQLTKIYPTSVLWKDLEDEAICVDVSYIPQELKIRPWLLALWWHAAPQRFTSGSSKIFASAVNPGWGAP